MTTAIAIASSKGGVGKTTVSLNLAYAFAKLGWKTALVDVDPQGAVGYSLPSAAATGGLIGYLAQGLALSDALLATRLTEFAVLPMGPIAGNDTQGLAVHLEDGTALQRLTADIAAKGFDLVVFDTPCGFSGVTTGALRASQYVLAPLQAEPIALRTLPQLLDVLAHLRGQGTDISLAGVVLTMLQARNSDSLDVAQDAWSRLPDDLVLDASIPRDPVFLRASSAGVPVGLLSRRRPPAVAAAFDQLAMELLPRINLEQAEDNDEPYALFA